MKFLIWSQSSGGSSGGCPVNQQDFWESHLESTEGQRDMVMGIVFFPLMGVHFCGLSAMKIKSVSTACAVYKGFYRMLAHP